MKKETIYTNERYDSPTFEVITTAIERGFDASFGEEGESGTPYDTLFLGDF